VATVAFLLVAYDVVAGLARVQPALAIEHGRSLLALSPDGFERAADHWLAGVHWLYAPAALYYDLAHINVTMGVFIAAYLARAEIFRRARSALVVINLIGLAVFWLYPAAPPRLLPGSGFIDIVSASGTWGSYEASGEVGERANAYGSMPSLHFAWALWVALTVTTMTKRPLWRVLGWGHFVLTGVVVIVTGNHYLIDLVAGASVALVAWLAVRRPEPAPAPAPVPVPVPVEAHRELTATLQGSSQQG
jgi:membrane-associated phospholipid phosphatase